MNELTSPEKYKPETTQIQRAQMLFQVREVAHGPGLEVLRAVLRDLDQAERLLRYGTDDQPTNE